MSRRVRSRWTAAIVVGGALLASLAASPVSWGQADTTVLVSRQSAADGGAGATGGIFGPDRSSISDNGRYVAFSSDATNLSGADTNGRIDVFVRDLQADTTTLVSRQSAADGGAVGDLDSFDPSISADGRYVAFESTADNLSTADLGPNGSDIFVRDLQADTTTLVSRQSAADGGAGGDGVSFEPSISADGRFVAFNSVAHNLSTADNNAFTNVFVRDLQMNTTTLVSRQSAGGGGAGADDSAAGRPSISDDGGLVAFASDADNLSSADGNAFTNVFVRDLQANTTTLVSRQSAADGGAGADGLSDQPSISADERFVAFRSNADNLSTADDNFQTNLFVRDLQTNTTTLVSRQSAADGGAAADGSSFQPSISAEGRFVAFTSNADNLSTADIGAFSGDIFVRDLQTDTTTLVSRQSATDGGMGASGGSFFPSISAHGRFVAFASEANNLSTADDDFIPNVYRRELASVCSITGTVGNDRIRGTAGDDVICGLGGDDRINGRGGSDLLLGDGGDDQLIGGPEGDALDGGAGDNDRGNYADGATTDVEVDLSTGAVASDGQGFAETVANVEIVEGAKNQANTLTGDAADNKLIGGVLADVLSGGGGADLLRGEVERAASGGNDTLTGGDGGDTLFPGLGSNTIDGSAGSDTLQYTGLGTALGVTVDNLNGSGTTTGAASDTFSGIESVTGTPNADDITVDFLGVASLVRGRDGDDTLSTADGDSLDTMNGGAGADSCDNADAETAINC